MIANTFPSLLFVPGVDILHCKVATFFRGGTAIITEPTRFKYNQRIARVFLTKAKERFCYVFRIVFCALEKLWIKIKISYYILQLAVLLYLHHTKDPKKHKPSFKKIYQFHLSMFLGLYLIFI